MRLRNLAIFLFAIFLYLAHGLYSSPLSIVNPETDLKVDAEYLNGILTASGILFGIWAIVMERKPQERVKRWQYERVIRHCFFISFALLVISVILVSLVAVNAYSSVFAILFCTASFITNAVLITLTLYYYKFKETEP